MDKNSEPGARDSVTMPGSSRILSDLSKECV